MTIWHTIETARDEWLDAPVDDDVLEELLTVSQQQVIAYAPALAEPAEGEEQDIPANYRLGQLRQAKNLWNAANVKSDGGMGEGDFIIRPHPLDWVIKQILRPRRAVPYVR